MDALKGLHKNKVVHGNLKLSNVFYDAVSKKLLVTDYGNLKQLYAQFGGQQAPHSLPKDAPFEKQVI